MTKTHDLSYGEKDSYVAGGEVIDAVLEKHKRGQDDIINLSVRLDPTNSLTRANIGNFRGGALFFNSENEMYLFQPPVSDVEGEPPVGRRGVRAMASALQNTADRLPIGDKSFEPSKRAKAILRALEYAKADLEAAGGTFNMTEVQAIFGDVSRQAISKRVRQRSIFAIQGKKGTTAFPTLQFGDDGQPIAGLRQVLEALPTESGWAILNFLVNPHNDLDGVSPIAALRSGDIDGATVAARRMGKQVG